MAPAIAWDITWGKTIGSTEVPLGDERQEGIGVAGGSSYDELPEAPARDSLPYQSWGNKRKWIVFIWGFILFSTSIIGRC